MLIDTHSHLNFKQFNKDLEEIIDRAKDAQVDKIIVVGSNLENSQKAVALAQKSSHLFASVGIHPTEVDLHWKKKIKELEHSYCHPEFISGSCRTGLSNKMLKQVQHDEIKNRIIAIGEVGLDYSSSEPRRVEKSAFSSRLRSNDNYVGPVIKKEVQIEALETFVELANRLNLPLIFHCREAMTDFIEVLIRKKPEKGVLHCFPGNKEEAKKILDLGLLISFTGMITFNSDFDEVVQYAPLNRIMVETDCPFLTPEPYRGQRNEPAYVVEVARRIAEIKNMSLYKVAQETTKNAIKLFALDKF